MTVGDRLVIGYIDSRGMLVIGHVDSMWGLLVMIRIDSRKQVSYGAY